VRDNCGGGGGGAAVTLTLKLHVRAVDSASVAVHCTTVVPTGKRDPVVRVHATWTGCTPPETMGEVKVTPTGLPFADIAVWFPGHVIPRFGAGGVGGFGVGVVGGADADEQAVNAIASRNTAHAARCRNRFNQFVGKQKIVLGAISSPKIRSSQA
jgi:hypothetical protein